MPWDTVRGLREAEDRGVETPVCGPVPVPYMVGEEVEVSSKSLGVPAEKSAAVPRSQRKAAASANTASPALTLCYSPSSGNSRYSVKSNECENLISNERMQELKNHVIKYIMNRVTKASKK